MQLPIIKDKIQDLLLGDEIIPDGCRFWNWDTNEKMDKGRFRFGLEKVEEKYQEVCNLVCGGVVMFLHCRSANMYEES